MTGGVTDRPPDELRGLKGLKKFLKAIRAFMIRHRITSILIVPPIASEPPSVEIKPGPTGTLIKLKVGSGAQAPPHPFHLEDATTHTGSPPTYTYKVKVYDGAVNSIVPTGTPFTVTGSGYIYLTVTTDSDGAVTTVVLTAGASVPADTDTTFHLAIGSYAVDTGSHTVTVNDLVNGSQTFSRCRNWFSFDPVTYSGSWTGA